MSDIFKINIKDIVSAVVSGVIIAVLAYLASLSSIFNIDFKHLLDVAVLGAIASLIKSFSTDGDGKLLGGLKIK